MKLLSLPKVNTQEFEGRTFDEALRLARSHLGEDVHLRCWRVRRGGVFGFFAKESFIAGLNAPAGAELSRSRAKAQEQSTTDTPSHLDHLVEATTDEVSFESDLDLAVDFNKVLAQAEAALMDAAAEQIDGLGAGLSHIGLPSEYLPDRQTLDCLARSLSELPSAPAITKVDGSLVIVVGPRREALLTAKQLVAHLGLADSDLVVGERTASVRQKIVRRRSAKKMTVLVVEASLKSRQLDDVATWINNVNPEHVLAAMPASVARTDFENWHKKVGGIEAMALTRVDEGSSIAQLMGALPIAFLDGSPATTLRWVAVLLNQILKERE